MERSQIYPVLPLMKHRMCLTPSGSCHCVVSWYVTHILSQHFFSSDYGGILVSVTKW